MFVFLCAGFHLVLLCFACVRLTYFPCVRGTVLIASDSSEALACIFLGKDTCIYHQAWAHKYPQCNPSGPPGIPGFIFSVMRNDATDSKGRFFLFRLASARPFMNSARKVERLSSTGDFSSFRCKCTPICDSSQFKHRLLYSHCSSHPPVRSF